MMKKRMHNSGMTLVEILVASAVLILAVTGILTAYLRAMELAEISRNMSRAIHAAQTRMEEIRSSDYDSIFSSYHQTQFLINGLNGYGISYVDNSTADLLEIIVSVAWKQKNGRVYGEDKNLNGVIDAGEDINGNGMLDSQVFLRSRLFER
jgi:Tfp pilus assembly protein PilV